MIANVFLFLGAAYCAAMMAVADWRHRLIPDVYLFPFLLVGIMLAANGALPWTDMNESAIAGIIGYGLAFGLNLLFKIRKKSEIRNRKSQITHDPIGMGDIKLLAAGGIWLGVTGLSIALVAACAVGYIWGRRAKQKFVPFAPFFFAGAAVAIGALLLW